MVPSSGSETLSLKRIILENKNSFSGTNDNNKLYFCGYTSSRNGEMIFGYVSSSFLTDTTPISVTIAFRYGSPDTEMEGDCALSSDNEYFVGVFST
jgi:hypothetical protein